MRYTCQVSNNHAKIHTVGTLSKGGAELVGVGHKYFFIVIWVGRNL